MKLLHTGDLHIGKKIDGYSMIEDQEYVLKQILEIIDKESIDTILLCGDIYDKSIPPSEAVQVLDSFLSALYKKSVSVYLISGNHDSIERLNFGHEIFKSSNIHIVSQFNGELSVVTEEDENGPIHIHMLPFIKPAYINHLLDVQTKSYEECVQVALSTTSINKEERNVLLAHQFVTASKVAPELSDSETKSLGGMDNVDYSVFNDFDYVALGHIHKPQAMGRKTLRYSGSILKYSFSESKIDKSVTIVELKEKSEIELSFIPLKPLRDMQEVICTLKELLDRNTIGMCAVDNYVHVTLTDEEEIIDAIGKVRSIYPNVMKLSFQNKRTQEIKHRNTFSEEDIRLKTPLELFSEFYELRNNVEITPSQSDLVQTAIEKLGESS